jgi:hypothetical protein
MYIDRQINRPSSSSASFDPEPEPDPGALLCFDPPSSSFNLEGVEGAYLHVYIHINMYIKGTDRAYIYS